MLSGVSMSRDLEFLKTGSNVTNGKNLAAIAGFLYNFDEGGHKITEKNKQYILITLNGVAKVIGSNKQAIIKSLMKRDRAILGKTEDKFYQFGDDDLAARLTGSHLNTSQIEIYSRQPILTFWDFEKHAAVRKAANGLLLDRSRGLSVIFERVRFNLTGKVDKFMSQQECIKHIQCNAGLHCGTVLSDDYIPIQKLENNQIAKVIPVIYKTLKYLIFHEYDDRFTEFEHDGRKGLHEFFPKSPKPLNIPISGKSQAAVALIIKTALKQT